MLLRNYKLIQAAISHPTWVTTTGSSTSIRIDTLFGYGLKAQNGAAFNYIGNGTTSYYLTRIYMSGGELSNSHLLIGTGDTPVTSEDYMLANKIAQLVPFYTVTYDNASNKTILNISGSYTNSTGSSVIIKELGFSQYIPTSTTGTNLAYIELLISREVLATPVTVANGETAAFAIQIEI